MDPFSDLYQENLISGYCKKEDTADYFHRVLGVNADSSYTELDGINISRLGYGSYRIARGNLAFTRSLQMAIMGGINLIDTSSNYGDGSSESMIGDVLKELIFKKELRRGEIFIVTKIGYIQGRNRQLVEEMENRGAGFSEVTYYDSNCFHCISPDFLDDQLERARKRLGLFCIDAVLLHNPEYFLMDREKHNVSEEKSKAEYYERIEKAFAFLESKRKEGVIRYFGISSNTFPVEESAYTHTSLSRVWAIAEKIRVVNGLKSSGFRLIQFPANLYETGFITEKNNQDMSIAEFASRNNLFTLTNRPLNAMKTKGGMDRLAIVEGMSLSVTEISLNEYLSRIKEYQNKMFQALGIDNEDFTFVSVIETYKEKFATVDHYKQALNYSIIPQLKKVIARIERLDKNGEFYEAYLHLLNEGIERLGDYLDAKFSIKMKPLLEKLQKKDSFFNGKTLSQSSVLSLLSFQGINSVLVGMRSEGYVEDMLPVLKMQPPNLKEEDLKELEI